MIKNERQYRITKAQAERFERTLAELMRGDREEDDVHLLIAEARKEAVRSQLADLQAKLREYELLKAGDFKMDELEVVSALPAMLIKARIARGLSQKELAERVGLKEQQIQRYEATDYASASLSRIREVVSGLGAD